MKKIIILLLFTIILSTGLFAAEAGTGFSLFFPESFYEGNGGTISVENGLSTSIGLGGMLSVPIGFSYNKIQGYMVEGATVPSTKPWFMGDSFMGYAMLKGSLPLGPLFFEVFGGGGINWNAGDLTAFEGNIAADFADDGEYAVLSDDFAYTNSLGYGWLAGASFGVTIGQISVSMDFLYRDLKAALDMSGSYSYGAKGALTNTSTINEPDAMLVIRGFTVGIGGSFAF
ncbi:MAG: hypothetical protein DRP58_05765 [Spirochaetes bacterium]|nr:MAG: hypothetical protein DRP58_05765 [Spirochaetota bacterium]